MEEAENLRDAERNQIILEILDAVIESKLPPPGLRLKVPSLEDDE